MKVLLSKAFHEGDLDYLAERVHQSVHFIKPDTYDVDGVLAKIDEADVLFGGMLDERVLQRSNHLKLIQIPWTGVDNLDFDTLSRFSIPISNSHSNAIIVAEHTIALMLGIARKLAYHDRLMREDRWNRVSKEGNAVSPFSTTLFGKRILYIGFGAIARQCHQLLSGFGMQTSAVNTTGQVPEGYEGQLNAFSVSEVVDAVADQDVVVIALPLTDASRTLIDSRVIAGMSETALLVNVSRGSIIDESALFSALQNKTIGGAAIDTWYQAPNAKQSEVPPSAKHDFASLDNILMSPHRAGYAVGGFPHLDDPIVNLNNLVSGKALINVIDTHRRYLIMANVLLTCVGRRNYLACYFREALNGNGNVIGADMNETAPGLVDCDKQCIVSSVYADNYIDELLAICKREAISLLVSLNDLELPVLAEAKTRFAAMGVVVVVSDMSVISRCFDKLASFQWFRDQGIPTADTWSDLDSATAALDSGKLDFPCIVKPRWGSGSIGIFVVETKVELEAAHALAHSQVRRGLLSTASAQDLEHSVLVQAMCPGVEYGCDILNDLEGQTRAVMTKQKLAMRAGETDKAVLRDNPVLKEFCNMLGQKSAHIGNLDCDIFVDGDHFEVLEMNPRFGGGYPFSHVAGADFPAALLKWGEGLIHDPESAALTYDIPYSKFDTLRRVGMQPLPSVTTVRSTS